MQVKKAPEDIECYLELAPKFGEVLSILKQKVQSGDTELTNIADASLLFEKEVHSRISKNAKFPFARQLNQYGEPFIYPICLSIGSCIAHGRYNKIIREGNIVKVDAGFSVVGPSGRPIYFDAAFTAIYGSREQTTLTEAPLHALRNISQLKGEISVVHISALIESIAIQNDFQVVNYLSGHGIGYQLHEKPIIPNVLTASGVTKLVPETIVCPEPMYVDKDGYSIASTYLNSNGWSVEAEGPSSHWETMFYYNGNRMIDIVGVTD